MGGNTVIVTICVVYFLVMIGTGIYASRKNKKASDFLVAGRKLNAPMTAITLAAVQIGVGIVLSSATNGYNEGFLPQESCVRRKAMYRLTILPSATATAKASVSGPGSAMFPASLEYS